MLTLVCIDTGKWQCQKMTKWNHCNNLRKKNEQEQQQHERAKKESESVRWRAQWCFCCVAFYLLALSFFCWLEIDKKHATMEQRRKKWSGKHEYKQKPKPCDNEKHISSNKLFKTQPILPTLCVDLFAVFILGFFLSFFFLFGFFFHFVVCFICAILPFLMCLLVVRCVFRCENVFSMAICFWFSVSLSLSPIGQCALNECVSGCCKQTKCCSFVGSNCLLLDNKSWWQWKCSIPGSSRCCRLTMKGCFITKYTTVRSLSCFFSSTLFQSFSL